MHCKVNILPSVILPVPAQHNESLLEGSCCIMHSFATKRRGWNTKGSSRKGRSFRTWTWRRQDILLGKKTEQSSCLDTAIPIFLSGLKAECPMRRTMLLRHWCGDLRKLNLYECILFVFVKRCSEMWWTKDCRWNIRGVLWYTITSASKRLEDKNKNYRQHSKIFQKRHTRAYHAFQFLVQLHYLNITHINCYTKKKSEQILRTSFKSYKHRPVSYKQNKTKHSLCWTQLKTSSSELASHILLSCCKYSQLGYNVMKETDDFVSL